jgi:hypothetical protein
MLLDTVSLRKWKRQFVCSSLHVDSLTLLWHINTLITATGIYARYTDKGKYVQKQMLHVLTHILPAHSLTRRKDSIQSNSIQFNSIQFNNILLILKTKKKEKKLRWTAIES